MELALSNEFSEARSHPRIACRLPAHIEVDGTLIGECVLTDISALGCRIHPGPAVSLPKTFTIHSEVFERPIMASLKWCGPGVFGVSFTVAKPVDVPLPPGCASGI